MIFIFYMVTIVAQMIMFLILLTLKLWSGSFIFNVSLIGNYGLCSGLSMWMQPLPCVIISQMVPKSSQGYVQGIHQAFFRFGAPFGLFLPVQVYKWLSVDVFVILTLSAVLMFVLIYVEIR